MAVSHHISTMHLVPMQYTQQQYCWRLLSHCSSPLFLLKKFSGSDWDIRKSLYHATYIKDCFRDYTSQAYLKLYVERSFVKVEPFRYFAKTET